MVARRLRTTLLLACVGALAACAAPEAPPAVTGGGVAAAAARRGELLSLACQACHPLEAGADHRIGPNLHGIFGRAAGTQPGFAYSEALRQSGIVWTPALLEQWLTAPNEFLPGTTMAFTGYADAEDRRALMDYLVAATSARAASR